MMPCTHRQRVPSLIMSPRVRRLSLINTKGLACSHLHLLPPLGTLLNNYAHIFDLLTRMRQAVDHPYLIVYSKRKCEREARGDGSLGQPLIANGSTDCDICQELPTCRIVSTCCGAAFCRSCVEEYVSTAVTGAGDDHDPHE